MGELSPQFWRWSGCSSVVQYATLAMSSDLHILQSNAEILYRSHSSQATRTLESPLLGACQIALVIGAANPFVVKGPCNVRRVVVNDRYFPNCMSSVHQIQLFRQTLPIGLTDRGTADFNPCRLITNIRLRQLCGIQNMPIRDFSLFYIHVSNTEIFSYVRQ